MPSCLLVLIFIYRFSSFSLPFLCTDGTLQLAPRSASYFTSPPLNAFHILLPRFCCKIRYFRTLAYREARLRQRARVAGEHVLVALLYSKAIKVTLFPHTPVKGSWYGSKMLSETADASVIKRCIKL